MCQPSLEPTRGSWPEVVDSVTYITVRLPLRASRAWASVCRLLPCAPLTTAILSLVLVPLSLLAQNNSSIALPNGRWFDGRSFELRTAYSVDGRLTFRKPARVDRTIDLAGTWIVPPFAEAHNHNITGWEHDAVEERNRKVISKYVADGVFYVKIQGSFPLTDALRRRLPINRPGAPDVAFAQTFLTATGGHPIALHEQLLLPRGLLPGTGQGGPRRPGVFTIDSEADLETKWPRILALRPDFIKTNLWFSEEFAQRKNDPAYLGRKALDPHCFPGLSERHTRAISRCRRTSPVAPTSTTRWSAGVDEIVHMPAAQAVREVEERIQRLAPGSVDAQAIKEIAAALSRFDPADSSALPLRVEDARLAAQRGTVVITTALPSWPAALPAASVVVAGRSRQPHCGYSTIAALSSRSAVTIRRIPPCSRQLICRTLVCSTI